MEVTFQENTTHQTRLCCSLKQKWVMLLLKNPTNCFLLFAHNSRFQRSWLMIDGNDRRSIVKKVTIDNLRSTIVIELFDRRSMIDINVDVSDRRSCQRASVPNLANSSTKPTTTPSNIRRLRTAPGSPKLFLHPLHQSSEFYLRLQSYCFFRTDFHFKLIKLVEVHQ